MQQLEGRIMSTHRGGTPVEVRHGRRAVISTDQPDWITLSGASPTAVHIYAILAAHVNQRRGDGTSWPTQETLAAMVGYSRGDKVKPFIDELRTLGAVDVEYMKVMPRRCIYTVHETPLPGYAGPMTVAEWYATRDETKAQVSAVTPARGEQGEPADEEVPVTPQGGEHVTPVGGEHVSPQEGDKQPRNNNQEKTPPPTVDPQLTEESRSGLTGGGDAPQEEKPPNLAEIARWFARRRDDWSTTDVEAGLTIAMNERKVSLATAAQALRELLAGEDRYGRTDTPYRLRLDQAWWKAVQPRTAAARARLAAEPRCQERGHERNPANRCLMCMTDQYGPDEMVPDPDADAKAAAYTKAVRERQRAGLPPNSRQGGRKDADVQVAVAS